MPSLSARTPSAPTTGYNAVGLLHEEMRRLGSLVMRAADDHKLPAGGALAVDREGFSAAVTAALEREPLVDDSRARRSQLPPQEWDSVIVATGPLTSPALARFDPRRSPAKTRSPFSTPSRRSCIATSSTSTSPGSSRATTKPGPAGSGADYINCPLTREQYDAFIDALARRREDRVPRFREGRRPISTAACRSR